MRGLVRRVKELTGIYGLGFDRDAMLGVMIPIILIVVIGGVGFAVTEMMSR